MNTISSAAIQLANCATSNYSSVNNNNNVSNNVALTLDQSQIQQITQLMNEMHQQEFNFNNSSNNTNNSTISINGVIGSGDIVHSNNDLNQQTNNEINIDIAHGDNSVQLNNSQNQLIFSPDSIVKLESQIHYEQEHQQQNLQHSTAHQVFLTNQQNEIIDNQQQHQITQVHTIMLNGQPALFIPASSAMSSNLLSQMLMNNNNASVASVDQTAESLTNSLNNQTFDLSSLQVPMQINLNQNQLISLPIIDDTMNITTQPSTKSPQLTPKQRLISPRKQKSGNNNQQSPILLNNNFTNIQQSPTSNNQQQSQIFNLAQFLNTSNNPNILNSTDVSNLLLNLNNNNQLTNIEIEQNQIQSNLQQQQQQQIICIQPDGNIVFQTVQPMMQQQPQQHQIIQQENNFNNISSNKHNQSVNNSSKKRKANTVASNLSNGGLNLNEFEVEIAKPRKNYKVANLLSSSENKQKSNDIDSQQQQQVNMQQLDLQKVLQFQIQSESSQQQQQQWVIINNQNNVEHITNIEALLQPSNATVNTHLKEKKSTKAKNLKTKANTKKSTAKTENIDNKVSNVTEEVNELMNLYNSIANNDLTKNNGTGIKEQQEDTEEEEDDDQDDDKEEETLATVNENGAKRKRKACDCPNCIKWKQSIEYREQMGNKRTHSCHKCPKEYNKTSHLRAHLRAHDGYRPYVCDFSTCRKSFTRSDELKRHKRIHNDDRNFPCTLCKKKFLRSDHLNKHYLVHKKTIAIQQAALLPSPKQPNAPQNQIRKTIDEPNLKQEEISSIASSSSSSTSSATESPNNQID